MEKKCYFCEQAIKSSKGRWLSNCKSKYSVVKIENECWLKAGNSTQKLCVQSSPQQIFSEAKNGRVYSLLKSMGTQSLKGEQGVEKFILSLSAFERYALLEIAVDELKDKLTTIIAKHSLSIFPAPHINDLPEFPSDFEQLINDYRTMLLKRYERLVEKGHSRSKDYVLRNSSDAIRFLKYLTNKNITSWTGVGRTQLVSYLNDEGAKLNSSLKRFIKFANNKKNPLRKINTGKPKKSGTVLTETPRPKIIPPDEVDRFLEIIKKHCSEEEYVLAWLVGRMGLTLIKAHSLKLSQIKVNDDKKCVIKPAEVWVSLPARIGEVVMRLANKDFPNWQSEIESKLDLYELFAKSIPSREEFRKNVLMGHARELRTSAIFALIQKGHTDRVTIKRTTGVSMPTIVKLESLFSVDLHRRLDPEFIKLRNLHITGEIKND